MNLAIFDTETTGLVNSEMIELACMIIDVNTNEIKKHQFSLKPETKISPASTAIHGIDQDTANTFDDSKDVTHRIYDLFKSLPNPTIFVAHNILFDNEVVNYSFNKHIQSGFQPKLSIDTLRFAKHLIDYDDIGGYKLDAIFYYLFPSKLKWMMEQRATHDALTDCELTYQVLAGLKEKLESQLNKTLSYEEVMEYVNAPIDMTDSVWTFGKHKGTIIKNTPTSYMRWCITSDFGRDKKNEDLIYTMKKLLHS